MRSALVLVLIAGAAAAQPSQVPIGTPTPTMFGVEQFAVGPQAGEFHRLRIDRTWGTIVVRQIEVRSAERGTRTLSVETRLDAQRPAAFIDLGGATQIDSVTVKTDPAQHGSYSVYGVER